MALAYFAQEGTQIDIMEVGMGGRLDATNVICPMVSVITNVSLEHQQYLGKTLRQIAFEKAGIIKEGVPVVTGVARGPAREVIGEVAEGKKAPCLLLHRDFTIRQKGQHFHCKGVGLDLDGLTPGLKGTYQRQNLALAIAAAGVLIRQGLFIQEEHIRNGVRKATWPGRFHEISRSPRIILDGAHNPNAMKRLKEAIKKLPLRRLLVVIGIMADKEKRKILREIVPISDFTIFTRPSYYRAEDPEKLYEDAREFSKNGIVIKDLKAAIEHAISMADKDPDTLILITGSLFTVGEALSLLAPDEYQPDPVS
jgi:dihydrofolate synthase/folylpolyglutamate synthase